MEGELWTLTELTDLVGKALHVASYAGADSGRVNDEPDLRTLRYYTTLKLLDRPAEMRGRTAYYHRRHLLQAVAIKQLQATGLSLREVQSEILNLPDKQLAEIAAIPETFWTSVGEEEDRRARFWAAPPEPKMNGEAPPQFTSKTVTEIDVVAGVRLVLDQSITPAQRKHLAPALAALRDAITTHLH